MVVVALMTNNMAQGQTTNTFSSYSMFGLGELRTQGTILTRSMGGAGVALRSRAAINLLNPAAYSIALQRGILFDFAFEGGNYFSTQSGYSNNSSYATANIHDIAVQIPLSKGIGMGVSVTPYSSTGYDRMTSMLTSSFDFVDIDNSGGGDITELKFGVGWEVANGLSIGVAAQYYWGTLTRSFNAVITNFGTSGDAVSLNGSDNTSLSKIKGQVGVQWTPIATRERQLVLGATFDIGGELSPEYSRVILGSSDLVYNYAQSDTTTISIVQPRKIEVGVSYETSRILVAADYSYQSWGSSNSSTVEMMSSGLEVAYTDVNQVRLGVEYVPRRTDVRRYFNRVAYRAGVRYGGYQYTISGESIPSMAVTAGAGFPINTIGISKIDVGLEWGRLGSKRVVESLGQGLILENSVRLSLGFTLFGDDYWFQRPQID